MLALHKQQDSHVCDDIFISQHHFSWLSLIHKTAYTNFSSLYMGK